MSHAGIFNRIFLYVSFALLVLLRILHDLLVLIYV